MTPDSRTIHEREIPRIWPISIIIIVLFVTCIALLLAASETGSADEWTIMVYLNGDNDLKGYAKDDLDEMTNTNTEDNLLILHDDNTTLQQDTELFHYRNGQKTDMSPAWLDAEENMGAQSTLEDFVDWCMDNYPSENTMLIIWDHGGAWKGVSWDDNSADDNLRLPEIREALNNSLGGEKLDIIYFGACSMSTVEVSYELQDHVDYLVGAEKTGWVYGTVGLCLNFRVLFEHMEGNYDPEDVCEFIVDESMDIQPYMEKHSHIWSAIDVNRIDNIVTDLDTFSEELDSAFPEHYMAIINAREQTEEYKNGKRISLWHFAENIQGEASLPGSLHTAAGNLMVEIDAAVIANGSWTGTQAPSRGSESRSAEILTSKFTDGIRFNTGDKDKEESRADHSHGIQIYFPINRSVRYRDYWDEDQGVPWFTERTRWDNWIWLYTSYFFVDDSNSGYEDGSRKYPYSTIQEAIDEAGSNYVIRVFQGTYHENVEVNENLTLIGNGTNTVIDAPEGNAVNITASRVRISGFMIYTPTGDDDIEIQAEVVLLDNLTLTNCGGSSLHILRADDILVEWCTIRMAGGAGVTVSDSTDVVFDNCSIYDNIGNGVELYVSDDVEFSLCHIYDNGNHGVYVSGTSDTQIWDSDIYDNTDHGVYEALASSNTDVRYCYWGDDSGPGKSGPGSGDEINDPVLYSPWLGLPAGTQPNQIYYVDTEGLIQDAVDHAEKNDFVFVHQGTYFENVMVDKTLTISGITDTPPYPTVDARNFGTGFFIKADWVRIERFNITSAFGGNDGIQIGSNSGDIVRNVVISDCNFNGSTGNCIELHFTAEDCTIRDCSISGAGTSGILLVDSNDLGATGNTIVDCVIFNCTDDGIEIEEYCLGNEIRDCDIFENGDNGINDEGQGTGIVWCDIHENDRYGVYFYDSSNSFVNDCNIWGHQFYGVSETNGANGCDAMFNYWGDGSGPSVSGPGTGDGVNMYADYSPWLKYPAGTEPQTYIVDETGHIQDAIDHAQNGDTVRVLTGNFSEYLTVDRSINLMGNGSSPNEPSYTCIITWNASDALLITADWVNVSGFHITNGVDGESGIEILGDHVTIADCVIDTCGTDGILFRNANHGTVTAVEIENAGGYGIRMTGPFSRNGKVKIKGSSNNLIDEFSIHACGTGGILIEGTSHRNSIVDGTIMVDGIGIEVRGNHCTIERLESINNGDIAVYCNGSFAPLLDGCYIGESFDTGVYLIGADNWTILNCDISSNAEGGIISMNSPYGRLIDSEVWLNSGNGIHLASSDLVGILGSCILENEDHGISISSSDDCLVSDCEIYENGDDGVHVSISGNVKVTNSAIEDNVDFGVYNPTAAEPVNARWNSWGGAGGPGGEGPGSGDEVSEHVDYAPWLGYWAGVQVMPLDIGTDNTSKAQLALDRSVIGGKVHLAPGLYKESLVIHKKVDIIGAGSGVLPIDTKSGGLGPGSIESNYAGSGPSIIDGDRKGSVITVLRSGRNIMIRGLRLVGSGSEDHDAGIRIYADSVNIEDVECTENANGLLVEKGMWYNVSHCVFRNNVRGIRFIGSDHALIINCTTIGNVKDGIDISQSRRTTILNNVIEGNGLGILIRDGSADCVANKNRIIGNRDFAVQVVNNGNSQVDAKRNFWGKDTGPFHTKHNPKFRKEGPGGNITDLVEFAPWFDEQGNEIHSQSDLDIEDPDDSQEKEWWDIPGFTVMAVASTSLAGVILHRLRSGKRR